QAEDGIRDFHVTGVQTCALPISHLLRGDAEQRLLSRQRAPWGTRVAAPGGAGQRRAHAAVGQRHFAPRAVLRGGRVFCPTFRAGFHYRATIPAAGRRRLPDAPGASAGRSPPSANAARRSSRHVEDGLARGRPERSDRMEISLARVVAAARERQATLTPEVAGYVILLAAQQAA